MGQGAKYLPTFNEGYDYSAGGCRAPIPSSTKAYKLRECKSRIMDCLYFLIAFIMVLTIIVGIPLLITWSCLKPTKPKFYVDGINFSNRTSSSNEFALEMSVRNGDKNMGIYYGTFYATSFYGGQSFASIELQDFYQGHKSTTVLHPSFVSTVSSSSFNTSGDVADIEVKLRSCVRFKLGKLKTRHYGLRVKCRFSVPLNETTATTFTKKKCKVDIDRGCHV